MPVDRLLSELSEDEQFRVVLAVIERNPRAVAEIMAHVATPAILASLP